MSSLDKLQRNWEGFASVDPLWAICVDSTHRDNKWTQEEFFATGQTEIGRVMGHIQSLGLSLDAASPALDFGCGVGRLTRALSDYFPECWGVDISPTMIRLAKEFNLDRPACHFCLNERDDLQAFPDGKVGFIYTSIVLQHIKREYVSRYLLELVRILKAGGVFVFQVPETERSSIIARLRSAVGDVRSNIYRLLRRKSIKAYRMEMHCFPEKDIRRLFSTQPVRIVDVRLTNSSTGGFNGDLRFLDRPAEQGFVSKQYCVVKTV